MNFPESATRTRQFSCNYAFEANFLFLDTFFQIYIFEFGINSQCSECVEKFGLKRFSSTTKSGRRFRVIVWLSGMCAIEDRGVLRNIQSNILYTHRGVCWEFKNGSNYIFE